MVLSEGGFQERLWVLEGFVICWEVEMKPCLWQVEQCKVFCGGKVDFLLSITSFSSSSNPVGPVNVSTCLSFPAVDTLISDPEHCSSDVLQWLVGSPLSLGQYIYKTPPCWSSPCSSSWNRSLLAPETLLHGVQQGFICFNPRSLNSVGTCRLKCYITCCKHSFLSGSPKVPWATRDRND